MSNPLFSNTGGMEKTPQKAFQTWTMDTIIQKIFPILGILMITGGLGYFFYDGFWGQISDTARLGIGFFIGSVLITGGHAFNSKLNKFADIIIGGGILVMYATLIYGSGFNFADKISAIIPESFSLLVSAMLCGAISFYSLKRKSKIILILGMIGAYLTPFFIGEIGAFEYQSSFTVFLLYFTVISAALFIASLKMNLLSLMTVNMMGLFIGTLSISGFISGGFLQNPIINSSLAFIIILLHLGFVTLNTKQFAEKGIVSSFHYIIPFLWIVSILFITLEPIDMFLIGGFSFKGFLMILLSISYFGIWNYLDEKKSFSNGLHSLIYFLGFLSGAFVFIDLHYVFGEFSGLIISAISIVFGTLFALSRKPIRETAFLISATIGSVFVFIDSINIYGEVFFLQMKTILFCAALSPYLLHFILPVGNKNLFSLRRGFAITSIAIVTILIFNDIFRDIKIPAEFIYFIIPSGVLAILAAQKNDNLSLQKTLISSSFVFLILGYFISFFIFWDKLFPAHYDTFLSTGTSLIGITSLLICGTLLYTKKKTVSDSGESHFFSSAFFILILFQLGSYELIGIYNSLLSGYGSEFGIRALLISFWWVILSCFLIFIGIKNSKIFPYEKNIGMTIMFFSLGKIVLYDLENIDTNLKVLLFVVTGALLLGVSYFLHHQKIKNNSSQ